jgi:GR25 family glycosyltransferase involved in LPS biosynthesis
MSNFNTYVINLENDKEKYRDILKNLSKCNIKPIRFNAIDGRKKLLPEHNALVSKSCLEYCPFSAIGCGLSHLLVANQFHKSDPNNFCLILEDDAKPLTSNIKQEIKEVIDSAPLDWDIIRLYCQGFCNYDYNHKKRAMQYRKPLTGSTCAYLLSKRGSQQIQSMRLKWHIDAQFVSSNLKIYDITSPLFIPDSNISTSYTNNSKILPKIFGYKLGKYDNTIDWYLGNSIFREPGTKKVYNYYQLIGNSIIIVIIIILSILLFIRIRR